MGGLLLPPSHDLWLKSRGMCCLKPPPEWEKRASCETGDFAACPVVRLVGTVPRGPSAWSVQTGCAAERKRCTGLATLLALVVWELLEARASECEVGRRVRELGSWPRSPPPPPWADRVFCLVAQRRRDLGG